MVVVTDPQRRSGAVLVCTTRQLGPALGVCLGFGGEVVGEGKSLMTLCWLMLCFALVDAVVGSWI